MLLQFCIHHFHLPLQRFTLVLTLLLLSLPFLLIEQDKWRALNLKLFGVQTQVTVTDKQAKVTRIHQARVGWKESTAWHISYSTDAVADLVTNPYQVTRGESNVMAMLHAAVASQAINDSPRVVENNTSAIYHHTSVTEKMWLADSVQPGSTISVTYITDRPADAELTANLNSISYYIFGTLKRLFLTILAMVAMIMLYITGVRFAENNTNVLHS